MPALRAVLIGADACLPSLQARAGVDGEVLTFSDAQPLQALEAIARERPSLIVLERTFAATPRGVALIARLKADPSLREAEISVLAHDSDYRRAVVRRKPPAAAAAPAEPAPPIDWRGTRRAPRFRLQGDQKLQVDGNAAAIVDLSVMGAQILCPTSVRPNQRVRVVLADELQTLRFGATIAWASFELPSSGPRYRAGIEFRDADPDALQAYCDRNRLA